jgi:hypothetical protein
MFLRKTAIVVILILSHLCLKLMIMKNKITLLSMLTCTIMSIKAQGPITLTAENFPPLTTYKTLDGMNIETFPFGNVPETWDFGNVSMPFLETLAYPTATDPFFSTSDSYRSASRTALGAILDVEYYWTKNAEFFGENGWKIYQNTTSLVDYTGNANDFVSYPLQKQLFDVSREILRFPVTYGYTNSSDSRRVTNFNLTINAYGINNTPGQLVTHLHRHDTIVGYGKMRVYTPQGPSVYYDVLAMKSWQYELDSFYLGGSPAPPALLTAFGLTQNANDVSDKINRLYFYRENNSAPFMLVNFESNPFDFYTGIFVHGDNLSLASAEELSKESYQVFIYPNPSNGKNITLEFFGKQVNEVNYIITDITGKLVKEVKNHLLQNNKLNLDFGSSIEAGSYFVNITNKEGNVIASEKIQLQ